MVFIVLLILFVPMADPVGNAGQPLGAHLACSHGRCGEAFEKAPRIFEKLSPSGCIFHLTVQP